MHPTDGLARGMKAVDLDAPIQVPVGEATLGRMLNVIGEPVDHMGEIKTDTYYPIHRQPPSLEDQSTQLEMFETGIKVIDLIQPFLKGGKIGLFGGASTTWPRSTEATPSSPVSGSAHGKATTCGWR
jgi:F-type H+-transporting ATPase subunit beta